MIVINELTDFNKVSPSFMKFSFTLDELEKEFEAQWEIAVTELEDFKKLATDLRRAFWSNFIIGGIVLGVWNFLSDKL